MNKRKFNSAPECIRKIDWTDLRTQKRLLLETINNDAVDPEHKEGLEGILALLDSIQDYAVDKLGISEMFVYDFELEEEREKETDEEKFARESAQRIFDELCESDGFHQDDEIPEKFIASIMADRYQADIIRGKLRAQILDDMNHCPAEFTYGRDGYSYDKDMREDYEGVATAYIREKYSFMSGKTKTLWLCPHCGSDNVDVKTWIKANTNEIYDGNNDTDDGYCNDCEQHGELISQELPIYKKVVGFQVVDEERGEMHPTMEASFCLYNLSQAKEMLTGSPTMKFAGNWKLLCIWSGDVEEPTLMFEGDPRD